MRMIKFALVALFAAMPGHADQKTGGKVIECYCTDSAGGRVELGQSICLIVDGRAFMAKCEMALNNPIWRDTGEACTLSYRQLSGPGLPTV